MICRAYVKLASNKRYLSIISDISEEFKKSIEIQKRTTYEKNAMSKILVVYTIENKANEIGKEILTMKNPMFRYLSFQNSQAESRVVALDANEMINAKAMYKKLFNVNAKQEVKHKKQNMILEVILQNVNHNGCPFFLAIEVGLEKI